MATATQNEAATIGAAPASNFPQKNFKATILRAALWGIGGLFVFILISIPLSSFLGFRATALGGVPNNAVAAILLNPQGGGVHLFDEYGRIPPSLQATEKVFTILRTGEMGFLFGPKHEMIPSIETTGSWRFGTSGYGAVAYGTDPFVNEWKRDNSKIPWWINLRANFSLKNHNGVILWGPDQNSPWYIGTIDLGTDALEIKIPDAKLPDSAILEENLRLLIETLVPETTTPRRIRLPDGTVATEMRVEKPQWTEENALFIMKISGKTVFSYTKSAENSLCESKNKNMFVVSDADDAVIFAFSGDPDGIFICISTVDNL